MNVLFGILAVVFTLGMIGDKEKDNRRNYTIGFLACIAAIVLISAMR